ncbi:13993_t:CDS:2, partial [Cetraspora pellucida]
MLKEQDTEALITFLQEQELNVSKDIFKVLCKTEVNSQSFLMMTENKFIKARVVLDSAIILSKEVELSKNRTKKLFSLYYIIEELKEVFKLYKIITYKLEGENSSLCFCVEDVKQKLENISSVID